MLWRARSVATSALFERGRADHRLLAFGVLTPHLELHLFALHRFHDAPAVKRPAGLGEAAIADLERLQLRVAAREVGQHLGQEAGLKKSVQDDAGKADRAR